MPMRALSAGLGSTEISARLDAEEWRDLVGAYLDAASAAVTEMDGHVAKKLGLQDRRTSPSGAGARRQRRRAPRVAAQPRAMPG
jgi:hypothetical protein